MFIGHHAVGFAAKRVAPRVSLGVLFAAAIGLDLIWPIFVILGIEHVRIDPGNSAFTPLDFYDYPYTHSLLDAIGWSILAGVVYWLFRKSWKEAVIVGAAVWSHWLLDFVSHIPDLPLWPGGPRVGLGLWSCVPATIVVELALFFGGLALYLKTTKARDRIGSIALWSLVVFTLAVYALNILSPPPPSARAVAWAALALWLYLPWGWWIDRHREVKV